MLGTELIGWFAEVLGKRPDGVQVQPDRGRRIMPDLEVLQHPLSKWCHSKNSFRCDHITNRLPAEPSTPWNVRDSALHLPEGLCSILDIRRIRREDAESAAAGRLTDASLLSEWPTIRSGLGAGTVNDKLWWGAVCVYHRHGAPTRHER